MKKVIVAVTGASGSIYAKVLFDKLISLKNQFEKTGVVMSDNAKYVWKHELGNEDYEKLPFLFYQKNDFTAPLCKRLCRIRCDDHLPLFHGNIGKNCFRDFR